MADSEFTIYATADLHGYQDRLDRIADQVADLKPDVLVVAGDIMGFRASAEYLGRLNDLPVPVLTVHGNMDGRDLEEIIASCPNVTSLHLREATIDGVRFVGMGGTVPVPFRSRICLRDQRSISSVRIACWWFIRRHTGRSMKALGTSTQAARDCAVSFSKSSRRCSYAAIFTKSRAGPSSTRRLWSTPAWGEAVQAR